MNSKRKCNRMYTSCIQPSKIENEIQIEEILTEANAYSLI